MVYFTEEFHSFFRDLAGNNNRDWFNTNKKRYENSVKSPFAAFVEELIARIHQDDPDVAIQAKDAIFRINRDIRFSKDKSPYKTNVAAVISPTGRKNHEVPGFYLHFDAEKSWIGGGAYGVQKENLYKIRRAIADNPDEFNTLLKDRNFKKYYSTIKGEQNKVLPKEFKEAAAQQPLIANKQFYYMAETDSDILLRKNLPDLVMKYYHAGKNMNEFLKSAMGL